MCVGGCPSAQRRVLFFRISPSSPTTTCHLPRNLRRHHALEPTEKKKEEKEVEQLFFFKKGEESSRPLIDYKGGGGKGGGMEGDALIGFPLYVHFPKKKYR